MNKTIIIATAFGLMLSACSKKRDEISPSGGSGTANFSGAATINTAKTWDQQVLEASKNLAPQVSNVTANSAIFTLGSETMFVEKEGEEVYVSQVTEVNGRISKTVLTKGAGSNGKFVGIMCVITPSNAKEFVNWISKKSPSPFEEVFGKAFFGIFNNGPDGNNPDIKLNTKNLPKGVFALNGSLSARKVGTCTSNDCGQISQLTANPAKVDVTGDAGLFKFFANDQAYGESTRNADWSFMSTQDFGKGDYLVALGERYNGNKDSDLAEGFVWMVGLGRGTSTPPMTGIIWAVGYKKKVQKVIFTLAVFQSLKVK